MTTARRRFLRWSPRLLPLLVVFWVAWCFTYNHFCNGPFLHDAGWYSAIVFRQGFFPKNPPVVGSVPDYYGVHVSLLVSAASLLSVLFPGDRVDWYCLFQGAIFAPLALATPLLVRRPQGKVEAALLAAAAIAFALNGQVWPCLSFPHFEIFVVVGGALMLVGLATGREWLAWFGIFLALATREDGGFHVGLFACAALASDLSGRPFRVRRRRIALMVAVAVLGSLLTMALQRTFFVTANLFRTEYLGEPTYGHMTKALLVHRVQHLFVACRFVLFPFAGSVAIAIALRDPRVLLGGAAALPWFLLNFLAHQELKSAFEIYTGFPFVMSIFWVGAYLRSAARNGRSFSTPIVSLAAVSLLATLGFVSSSLQPLGAEIGSALAPTSIDRTALASFVSPLRTDSKAFGNLWFDASMASWVLEDAPVGSWALVPESVAEDRRDGIAFFGKKPMWNMPDILATADYARCGHLRGTSVFACFSDADRPLPPGFAESSPLLFAAFRGKAARDVGEHVSIAPTDGHHVALFGPFMSLRPNRYRATWRASLAASCTRTDAPPYFDVSAAGGVVLGGANLKPGTDRVDVDFEIGNDRGLELRTWTGPCTFEVTDLRVVRRP